MNNRNQMVWIPAKNTDLDLYEPHRQLQGMTPANKCYTNRERCQDKCDELNNPQEEKGQLVLTGKN